MTIEERIYNGDQARLVLENEAFAQAFADVEKELTEKWKTAPVADQAGRERVFQFLTALKMVQACLTRTLEDGKLAMKELEHKRTLAERARSAISSFSSEW